MGFCHLELLLHANTGWVLGLVPAGGASVLEKLPLILGGAIIGGSVSWFLAKRQSLTQHRVQQELWDRKFRLAEADRESAVTSLNQNNIDVKRIKGTYEAHVQRITSLQAELAAERAHAEQLRARIDEQDQVTQQLASARDTSQSQAAAARSESERKSKVHREISQERETLITRVSELEALLEQARAKNIEDTKVFRSSIVERDETISEWQRRHAEDQESASATLSGLEERILELEPTPALLEETRLELDESRAERARIARDSAAAAAELQTRATNELEALREAHEESQRNAAAEADRVRTELQERLDELEPVPGQLEASRIELQLVRDELASLLESTTAEKEAAAESLEALQASSQRAREAASAEAGIVQGELQSKLAALEPLPGQLESTRQNLETVQRERDALAEASATEIAELKDRVAHLLPLEELLTVSRGETDKLRNELANLEASSANHESELRERITELEPFPEQLSAAQSDLRNSRERVRELEPLVSRLARVETELAAAGTQNRSLKASSEQEIIELQGRVDELEPVVVELARREGELTVMRERLEALEPIPAQLRDREAELEALRAESEESQESARLKERELEQRLTQLEGIEDEFLANRKDFADFKKAASRDARAAELEAKRLASTLEELTARSVEVETLRGRLSELQASQKADQREAHQLRGQSSKLETRLTSTKLKLDEHAAQLREARAELTKLRRVAARAEAKEQAGARKAASKGAATKKPAAKAPRAVGKTAGKTAGAKENVKTIQPAPRRGQDDLTAISGIGPSYEKVLKKAGIHRFEQLATMTAPKLTALAEKIDIPVDRIKKDRWVQKAKAAHQKKYKR